MFDRIKRFVREVRIDLDFPRYERQQRDEHEQQAQKRFSTEQLNIEKAKLIQKIESEASSKFNASILEKENNKKRAEEETKETEYLLSFFLRHYKEELNELYAEKDELLSKKKALFDNLSEIKESLSEAFDDKNKAYSELNHYKDRIDSWHAKSDRTPLLFGNAGKKLPKHSLFGQSFGDLDSYKYHRDSAYEDVRAAKSQIGDLKQDQHELYGAIEDVKEEIGEVFAQINQVKTDRSKMYELKKSGYQRNELQEKLNELHVTTSALAAEIQKIIESRKEFINQQKHRYGVVDLEAKIRKIEEQKEQFMNSFDLEKNKQERKRLHREIWLKQRGVA
jgi:chromosome segregation ATPase